jgi:hypothetical protein
MASDVDICNLALSRLGERANVSAIDPPEGSPEAEHCARFYPIARDGLLEAHPWTFAVKRSVDPPALFIRAPDGRFAHALPAGALRIIDILSGEAHRDFHNGFRAESRSVDFERETTKDGVSVVLTRQEYVVIRYIARVVDTGAYSPLFVDALSWLLASHLAGPILKGETGAKMAQACYQTFRVLFGQAAAVDANQRRIHEVHAPAWIKGR